MLQEHDQIINLDILPRLRQVENAQVEFKHQIDKIQSSQQSLELTVMKDGQETRSILNKFVNHYFSSDKQKFVSDERVTMKRLSSKEKIAIGIIGAIAGSGGLVAAIATLIEAVK